MVPVYYDKQSHPISIQTLSHLAFWPQIKEDKLNQWANYKDLTQATTDTGLNNVREFGAVCVVPKTKETRTKFMCRECNIT